METYAIGDLARATGVKATTIRWYEQEGWLPPAARTTGGHRAYGAAHLRRLGFIRHARELGFESDAIRALLDLADQPDADCTRAHALATAQIAEIDARLKRLGALRAELVRMATSCEGGLLGSAASSRRSPTLRTDTALTHPTEVSQWGARGYREAASLRRGLRRFWSDGQAGAVQVGVEASGVRAPT
jgi:DNA-binding transcriptional MerR regulator